jgi:hypothetical protein
MPGLDETEKDRGNYDEGLNSSSFSKISRVSTPLETADAEETSTPKTPSSDFGIHSFTHNLKLSLSKYCFWPVALTQG